MAQEFTPILENDIGALAPDRTPAKVRAIDDQGRSINLTPTQLAAMAGIDYSLLTEQKTGEVWKTSTGEIKEVYAKLWRGVIGAYSFPGGIEYQFYVPNIVFGASNIVSVETGLNKGEEPTKFRNCLKIISIKY